MLQLSIDLTNLEEVAAASDLLRLIVGGEWPKGSHANPFTETDVRAQLSAGSGTPEPDLSAAQTFNTPPTLPPGASPLVPPGAPSSAGAGPSPIAPEVPQAGAPMPPPGASHPAPPIVPSVPAPNAGATPPASPAGGVELDTDGLPWDERIHAGTKTKTQSGHWKAKKGLNDEAMVNRIKAELRARMGGAPVLPVTGAASTALPTPPAAAAPFAPPAAPSAPALPVAPLASADPTTFDQFIARVSAGVHAGVLPPTAAQEAVVAHNMKSVTDLQQYPDFVAHVWRYLKQQYPTLQ